MINNISEPIHLSINLKGNLLSLDKPVVMGILNVTSDSFYNKSRVKNVEEATLLTTQMLHAGAGIIDIGASSSRPGAKITSAANEMEMLLPFLESLIQKFPHTPFSVDTYHAKTAFAAVNAGASMINDISAGKIDEEMFSVVAALKVPYVMMHMQGIPENMQHAPHYEHVVNETINYFVERVASARKAGIIDLIIDPGFGFGKSLEHNFQLLQHLKLFQVFQLPILCGLSRKSLINKVLQTTADQALNGTTVLNTVALLNGANILRVHDVLEAKQAIDLIHFYSQVKANENEEV